MNGFTFNDKEMARSACGELPVFIVRACCGRLVLSICEPIPLNQIYAIAQLNGLIDWSALRMIRCSRNLILAVFQTVWLFSDALNSHVTFIGNSEQFIGGS
jgi:hypothetical protein